MTLGEVLAGREQEQCDLVSRNCGRDNELGALSRTSRKVRAE